MDKNQKETTIDELAIMVAKGFENVNEQIKKETTTVRKEFKKELEEKIKTVREDIARLIAKVDGKSVLRDRKIDKKVNILTAGLKKKRVLESATISSAENIAVFPQAAKGR